MKQSNVITFSILVVGIFIFKLVPVPKSSRKIKTEKVIIKEKNVVNDTLHIKRTSVYHAVEEQTDSNPFKTADGSIINPTLLKEGKLKWCALSRDLIKDSYRHKNYPSKNAWQGKFKFGDTIRICSKSKPAVNGQWIVHDVLNKRYRNSIDLLIAQNDKELYGLYKDVKIIIKNN